MVNKEVRRIFDAEGTSLDDLELVLGDLPINLHESLSTTRAYKLSPKPVVPTFYFKIIPADNVTFKKVAGGQNRAETLVSCSRKIVTPLPVIKFFLRNCEEITGILAVPGAAAAAAGGGAGGLNAFPVMNVRRLCCMAYVVSHYTFPELMNMVLINEAIRSNFGIWVKIARIDGGRHHAWVPDIPESILSELHTITHTHGNGNNNPTFKYALVYVFGGANGFPAGSTFHNWNTFQESIHNAGVPNRSLISRFLLATLKEILHMTRGPIANPTTGRWNDAMNVSTVDNANNALGNGYADRAGEW